MSIAGAALVDVLPGKQVQMFFPYEIVAQGDGNQCLPFHLTRSLGRPSCR